MVDKVTVEMPRDLVGNGGEAHQLRVLIACLPSFEFDHLDDDGPKVGYEIGEELLQRINDALGWLQGAKA